MYVIIHRFHYLSDYIYIYMYICLSAVLFLSVCLPIKEAILLSSRTRCEEWDFNLWSICRLWAFTKLDIMYGTGRSVSVKRQDDHCYSDVCIYFSIHLSIYIFATFLFTSCSSFCLSVKKMMYLSSRQHHADWANTLEKTGDGWLSSNKMWYNIGWEVWPYEEARKSVI
jgi:hypothetical protein